jgi:flavin reductase (DIM6/NTAB) family NADH-FMN oxidoreductase RutF
VTVDEKAAALALNGLRSFPVAITTVTGARANGLIALGVGSGSVIDEAPRVIIGLTKFNLTHDMVLESGVFAMHLLSAAPEMLERSLDIIRVLGGTTGRDVDKLAGFDTTTGVTGSPVLTDALVHIEGRVINSMDCEENSYFMADVVAAEQHSEGPRLNIGTAWKGLGAEWVTAYEKSHEEQINDSRRRRGLPIPD